MNGRMTNCALILSLLCLLDVVRILTSTKRLVNARGPSRVPALRWSNPSTL